jgi:hypothetical protein
MFNVLKFLLISFQKFFLLDIAGYPSLNCADPVPNIVWIYFLNGDVINWLHALNFLHVGGLGPI